MDVTFQFNEGMLATVVAVNDPPIQGVPVRVPVPVIEQTSPYGPPPGKPPDEPP